MTEQEKQRDVLRDNISCKEDNVTEWEKDNCQLDEAIKIEYIAVAKRDLIVLRERVNKLDEYITEKEIEANKLEVKEPCVDPVAPGNEFEDPFKKEE